MTKRVRVELFHEELEGERDHADNHHLRESNARLGRAVASGERRLRECAAKNDTLVEEGRFKDEVAAMIVHDLKNPLAVIVANYDYLRDGFVGEDDCLEALQDSQSAGRRMVRLLANLADVARHDSGTTLGVCASELVLSHLLQLIVDQRRVLARMRNIEVRFPPSPGLAVVADADLVTRTIENIFDNAFRHTPSGGTIELALRAAGPDVEIRVGNSGRAIPIAERATVFDKHGQATSGAGRMNLGLGLYFCRLAIEAQAGKIWVEETARLPTVFAIRLPRPPGDVSRFTTREGQTS